MTHATKSLPTNLADLRESGWRSKTVKQEMHDNFLAALMAGEELYPGIVGYDETVIPEINVALLAQHDMNASDLARLLGVHPSLGSKILKGERALTIDHVRALAARFKVRPEVFID